MLFCNPCLFFFTNKKHFFLANHNMFSKLIRCEISFTSSHRKKYTNYDTHILRTYLDLAAVFILSVSVMSTFYQIYFGRGYYVSGREELFCAKRVRDQNMLRFKKLLTVATHSRDVECGATMNVKWQLPPFMRKSISRHSKTNDCQKGQVLVIFLGKCGKVAETFID